MMAGQAAPDAPMPAHTAAEAVIPDSPAGRRLRALVELLQSGDEARISAFVRDHVRLDPGAAAADAPARYRRLMSEHAGLTVVRVLLRESHHVDVLVRTTAGERILGVQVEPGTDGRIMGVFTGRP
jgi:hypothetical protein